MSWTQIMNTEKKDIKNKYKWIKEQEKRNDE